MNKGLNMTSTVRKWLKQLSVFVIAAMLLGQAFATDEITYFHNDIAGSPLVATNAAGDVAWKESYRPYGEQIQNQPAAVSNNLWFAGKPFDKATGLSYLGARYYDPMLGRFTSIDPVDYVEDNIHSFNRYAYANNNPYKYIDPDGRSPIDIAFLIYDVAKLGGALSSGIGVGVAAADVGLSVIGVISPIPGAGQAIKAANKAGDGIQAIYTGSKLAKNMAEAGNPVLKGVQEAHHIVAQNAKAAAPARKILEKHGIDIHGAENGAAMSKSAHRGTHTKEYYRELNDSLGNADSGANASQAVRDVLKREQENLQGR